MQEPQTPLKQASFIKAHTTNLQKFFSFLSSFAIKALILPFVLTPLFLKKAVINMDPWSIVAIFTLIPAFILYRHTFFDSFIDKHFGIIHIPSLPTKTGKSSYYKNLLRGKSPTERLPSKWVIKEGWEQEFFGAEPTLAPQASGKAA